MRKRRSALKHWLAERVEAAARDRGRTFALEQLVAALQDDARTLAVCEVLTGQRDFNPFTSRRCDIAKRSRAESSLPYLQTDRPRET